MKNNPLGLLALILVFAFLVRLYHFSAPVADWHSWRQADTSAVSRNFIQSGFDLLHPRFDDISNVPSKLDNPDGYRFVEFPLYNLFQAGLYKLFGIFTIEEWGRLVSIFASLSSLIVLYLLMKKYVNVRAGLLTAFFYAFIPYNIYYGRTILPDTSMVAATLAAIYFFDLWIDSTKQMKSSNPAYWKFFSIAIVFSAAALLLKPYAIFFFMPMLYLAWKRFGFQIFTSWQLMLFATLSLAPLLLWREWILQYPEGIPSNTWLLNGNGIRFRPAFFRWIVYERIIKLISGYGGVILLMCGVYTAWKTKYFMLFASFALGSALYISVFATGNVQHDYYQILIMPTLAIFLGLGADLLLSVFEQRRKSIIGIGLVSGITILSFYFSWQIVKGYFYINNPLIIEAGKVVDDRTPQDARVIALYGGDTAFLYQTKRKGWANMQNPLPEMIKKGADYLILLHPSSSDVSFYETDYEITASSSSYILVKLH